MLGQVLEVAIWLGVGLGLFIVLGGVLVFLGLGIPLVSLWWRDLRA